MSRKMPIWLQSCKLENFPTRHMDNNIVQCRFSLPQTWEIIPELNETALVIEHVFQGEIPTDGLVMSFMEKADPQANLQDWVEVILGVTGFPILPINSQFATTSELLQWETLDNQDSFSERFQVDEMYLYEGLAQIGTLSTLVCLYVILARRGTHAWKIGLSLTSTRDDPMPTPQRSGAILGELSFL